MGFLNALQEENAPVDASKVAPMVVQVTRDVKSKSEYEAKQLMDDAEVHACRTRSGLQGSHRFP